MGLADYISPDDRYGELVKNVINPPPEQTAQAQAGAQPPPTASPAPGPRPAAVALTQTPAPGPSPVPAVKPPTPTPTSVTPSGAGPTAVGSPANTWQTNGYRSRFDQAQQGALDAAQVAAATTKRYMDQSDPAVANAEIEKKRLALATPLPTKDPTTGKWLTSAQTVNPQTGEMETINPEKLYKPGIGTRIVRGIDAVRRGGAMGAFDPKDVGGTAYGDPNANYRAAEAARQAQAGILSQQEQANTANWKATSERLKDQGADVRANATAFGNVARDETAQQAAEQKADYNQQVEGVKDKLVGIQQQLADQKADPLPKTDIELVMKVASETDPAKRKMYTQALQLRRSLKEEGADAAAARANTRNDQTNARADRAAIDRAGVAKNNAVAKAQALLDKVPNSTVNQKAAMDAMQDAQDGYEQELTEHGQTIEHLTVGSDLAWKDPKGNTVSHNQASAPTTTQPAAVTQNPTASANPAKRSEPPTPTTAPPSGAAGMRQAKDGKYYYVDGHGRAISAVK
jgi:hypothetical protein